MRRIRIVRLPPVIALVALALGASQNGAAQTAGHPALRPAPRYTLSGVVTDSGRAPLSDAEIGLDVAGEVVTTVRTGVDGRFRFDDLLPVRAALRVRRAGYYARIVAVD